MGLWDGIKKQLRSVIQWENADPGCLFIRWTDNGDEIKNASKLIVGPGQGCIFVYEGKVIAHHEKEGLYELRTANIPFWTTVTKFMQAFQSEHKVGIYFYKKTEVLDQKWGTASTIKYNDPKYNFPVGLKAYGNFSFKISDPAGFFVNVLGAAPEYHVDTARQAFVGRIGQPLRDYFAEGKFGYEDIDANLNEISEGVKGRLNETLNKLGFAMTDFRIEGTNFDDETNKRINRISDAKAEAHAATAVGLNYAQMQQLEAMREAARNEGGVAGLGVGMGAGMGLGQIMTQNMGGVGQQPGQQQGQTATAAPAGVDPVGKLKKLKEMLEGQLISQDEFDKKKAEILATM